MHPNDVDRPSYTQGNRWKAREVADTIIDQLQRHVLGSWFSKQFILVITPDWNIFRDGNGYIVQVRWGEKRFSKLNIFSPSKWSKDFQELVIAELRGQFLDNGWAMAPTKDLGPLSRYERFSARVRKALHKPVRDPHEVVFLCSQLNVARRIVIESPEKLS